MKTAKATLGSFRQSPRKMRMVVNAVRGKKVAEALVNLDFVAKKAAAPVRTLLNSALANAKALDIPTENLIIKSIMVNGGAIMYRRQPASRGRAHPIRKRTSSIIVELGEKETGKKSEVTKKTKIKLEGDKGEPKAQGQEAVASTAKKPRAKKATK